ncbi:hypothetical protein Tco_0115102 [Tanacetum coccineum]
MKKSIDERALHKREYDIWVNERQMQTTEDKVDSSKALDASLVDTESSGTTLKEQDTSSRSGNDAHADDADIRPIYDEEPMAEVQTTAESISLIVEQHILSNLEFYNEGEVHLNSCLYIFIPTKEGLRVSSELRIHDHNNELSSSKLVPKVVPPTDKTATSRQELELLFHHHITMLRSYALSWKPCQGDSLNLPDHRIHKDGDGDALFQLKSDSLPHAHA